MKKLFSSVLIFGLALSARAIYLQPFVYYGVDSFGSPVTNQITIDQWPPTNAIIGNNTNIVLSVPHSFNPDVTGFVSNNIAPGNYRLRVSGYSLGITFSVVSNSMPIIVSQVANIPIVTFQNFTLAQFSDAGTIASRSSNDFALASSIGTIARRASNDFALATSIGTIASRASNDFALASSIGTIAGRASNDFALASSIGTIAGRASNDFALATSLGTIAGRASNDFALATSLGTIASRASNDFHLADGYIGLSVSTGNVVTNGGVVWVFYKTNNLPGPAFTNQPQGSLMTTSNGFFGVLSNLVWIQK